MVLHNQKAIVLFCDLRNSKRTGVFCIFILMFFLPVYFYSDGDSRKSIPFFQYRRTKYCLDVNFPQRRMAKEFNN